jgi:alpha-glucosidase (family GH31 glycosyl hydrolase)
MLTFSIADRLHVKIYDAAEQVFQIQESVWPRPSDAEGVDPENSALAFTWTDNPFSFAITRRETNETLFDTSAASLVFETQYLRLRTALPPSPNLYGLGESTDPFHLNTTNYTRTVSIIIGKAGNHANCASFGTVTPTAPQKAPTFTELTPSTLITAVRMVLTVYSWPAPREWTSRLTTPRAST